MPNFTPVSDAKSQVINRGTSRVSLQSRRRRHVGLARQLADNEVNSLKPTVSYSPSTRVVHCRQIR